MQVGQNILDHTNTFEGGMNKDSSVLLQPDGTYRDARNFQVITHDGNNYTVEDVLGNRLIFTLPIAYDAVVANFQDAPMPTGFISFPDKLIVFHTNNESSSGGYGAIGELHLTNIGQSIASDPQSITVGVNTWTFDGYVPLYVHEQLKFSKMYKIEGFAFPENDNIGRVYWTDYFNEPRVFDTLNPIFTTYYASGDLVVGVDYMVISGAVTHNAVNYGIGLTAGNIFTAVNANYTVADGQALVIKYFPYQLLNWTPSRSLGNMSFYEYGTGVKRCGSHMYFYRLGKQGDGYFTSWSYGNYPIHIGVENEASALISPPNPYTDFVGDGSTTTVVVSDKSIKLNVTGIDTNFDIIQLACAEYVQLYDTPYAISIVAEATITGTDMTLEDFGNVNKGNLTLDDITLFPASILKCKTITTNKNYNIIANIVERSELDFSKDTVTISSFEYPMPVHSDDGGSSGSCVNQYGYENVAPSFPAANSANPAAGTIIPWSHWLVTFGNLTTDTVSYNGNNYVTGDVITGVASAAGVNAQNTITFTGSGAVRPCANLNKYTASNGALVPNANLLRTISWDYKDPLIASTHRGYWSHETYRFGVLFYDKKGNPFYVRWIGDYQMPLIADKLGLMRADNFLGENMWSLNPSLINIDGLELSQEIIDQIDGFSIVRSPRDVRIVAQGLTMQNNYLAGTPNQIKPSDCVLNNVATIADKVYTWISPDNLLIDFPEKQTIVGAGDKMEEACWVSGIQWGVDGFGQPVTYRSVGSAALDYYNVYAKFFNQDQDPSSVGVLRIATIEDFLDIDEADNVTNVFGISGTDYLNDISECYVNNFTNTDCAVPPAGAQTMYFAVPNRFFTGGKKSIIYMPDIKHYNNYPAGATNYTATSSIQQKIIMNYVKDLTNPYGGTGDSAVANTLYISTGHYQQINSTALTDTEVTKLVLTNIVGVFGVGNTVTGSISGAIGTVSSVIGSNVYITPLVGAFAVGDVVTDGTSGATGDLSSLTDVYLFNGIQIGGGDCFTNLVDYGYGLNNAGFGKPCSIGFYFPCESNSNYGLRRGKKISNKGMSAGGGISYNPPVFEDFSYNPAYSSEGVNFEYPALPVNFINANRYPTRARFAGQKIIGEIIDTFRVFLTNDYRDVDVQLGEINNVRAKGDYVYYWQNHGVGSMPILERQMISQTAGSATSLGTGGVLVRFDTISTKYGNQHQHGLTDTEFGWIWFDMRNKDVCVMGFGGQTQEITVPTGMKSYFSEIFLERLTVLYSDTYLNSQTFDISSDRPLIGTGIVGVYDPKNKMSYLTFKFRSYKKDIVDPDTYDQYQILSKDFTIGFSHVLNKFIGFYDKMPAIWHNHNQSVLSANNPKNIERYYAPDMVVPTPFEDGFIIKDGVKEYICRLHQDVVVYATPPDPAMFVEINTTNEIYIENEEMTPSTVILGYERNKFYNRIVNNEIQFVVNPKVPQAFAIDNQLQVGNTTNFNEFYYETETKSASDVGVKSWNRNYQLIDEGWNNNLPISSTGKLSGFYVMVKYVKMNWNPTNILLLATNVKVLQRVKSFFKLKY